MLNAKAGIDEHNSKERNRIRGSVAKLMSAIVVVDGLFYSARCPSIFGDFFGLFSRK